jgi:thiosulfate/3-mercaptopyruvate sulfurtransferase
MKKTILFIGAILLSASLWAQNPTMISAKDLGTMLTNKELVIVSAHKPADYAAVHITNSVNFFYQEIQVDVKTGAMKCPDDLAKLLGEKGIGENKIIVVYDDGTMKGASHVWWTLKYLGAKDVRILDGGIDAWKLARKPVTATPTKIVPTTFNLDIQLPMILFKDQFADMIKVPENVLVDAREANQYSGEAGQTTRKGHIPGATNLDFTTMVANGSFKSKEEILALAAAKGITPDKQIVIYCNSGVKAAVVYYALVEIAGFEKVKLYAAGFNEWESDPANEVVK